MNKELKKIYSEFYTKKHIKKWQKMEKELKKRFFHGSSRRSKLYGKPLSVLDLYKKRIDLAPITLRSVFHRSTLL